MSIKPAGSTVTITATDSALLYVDTINGPILDTQFYERMEYDHDRLRSVMNDNGSLPIFFELLGGQKMQYANGCNPDDTIRPIVPDDIEWPTGSGLGYDDIYRRFDIRRWDIRGASSDPALLDIVFNEVAFPHKLLLNLFQAYLQQARAPVSFKYIVGDGTPARPGLATVANGIIANMIGTGISISGMPLGDGSLVTLGNVLMTNFALSPEYEEPLNAAGTSSRVLRSWSATIEQRRDCPATQIEYSWPIYTNSPAFSPLPVI